MLEGVAPDPRMPDASDPAPVATPPPSRLAAIPLPTGDAGRQRPAFASAAPLSVPPASRPPERPTGSRGSAAAPGPSPVPDASRGESSMVARAILQFGVPGLIALIIVVVAGVLVLRQRGEREAVRDARQITRAIGLGMVQPRLTDGVLDLDPVATARLDAYVRRHVIPVDRAIARIKMWSADERIVSADEPRLIGRSFRLAEEEREALNGTVAAAELSDLSRPENRFERGGGRLL